MSAKTYGQIARFYGINLDFCNETLNIEIIEKNQQQKNIENILYIWKLIPKRPTKAIKYKTALNLAWWW